MPNIYSVFYLSKAALGHMQPGAAMLDCEVGSKRRRSTPPPRSRLCRHSIRQYATNFGKPNIAAKSSDTWMPTTHALSGCFEPIGARKLFG